MNQVIHASLADWLALELPQKTEATNECTPRSSQFPDLILDLHQRFEQFMEEPE